MSTLPHSAGSWVTVVTRVRRDDADLIVPDRDAIAGALLELFGAPLLVDDIMVLEHHPRWHTQPGADGDQVRAAIDQLRAEAQPVVDVGRRFEARRCRRLCCPVAGPHDRRHPLCVVQPLLWGGDQA